MRLKNMYLTCKKYIGFLSDEILKENLSSDKQIVSYTIAEYDDFVEAMNVLRKIDALNSIIKEIFKWCGDGFKNDMNIIYPKRIDRFKSLLKELIIKMNTIIDLGDSVGFEDIEYGFDIKIPPNLQLKDMSQCIADIDKALTQCPYLNVDGERIEFKNADVGSIWFEFLTVCTGTTIILLNLGKVVDKAVQIASHIKMVRQQKNIIKSCDMQNELAATMISGFEEIQKALVSKCADELGQEISLLENEDKERAKLSLNLLGEWMSRGMEIYSCLEAPQEIKDYFPKQEEQKAIMEPIKQLKKPDDNGE